MFEGPADKNGRVCVDPETLEGDLVDFVDLFRNPSDGCSTNSKQAQIPIW